MESSTHMSIILAVSHLLFLHPWECLNYAAHSASEWPKIMKLKLTSIDSMGYGLEGRIVGAGGTSRSSWTHGPCIAEQGFVPGCWWWGELKHKADLWTKEAPHQGHKGKMYVSSQDWFGKGGLLLWKHNQPFPFLLDSHSALVPSISSLRKWRASFFSRR